MKIEISELWETGRNILTYSNDEFLRPQNFDDLKKCENTLVGDKIFGKSREVMIDNSIVIVTPTTVRHPQGGTMYILEVE